MKLEWLFGLALVSTSIGNHCLQLEGHYQSYRTGVIGPMFVEDSSLRSLDHLPELTHTFTST